MRRREFLGVIGGATAWVSTAVAGLGHAQERARRIGILNSLAADDAEGQSRTAAFLQGLQEAGWAVGRNLRVEFRWANGRTENFRKFAGELVALSPDVILATGSAAVGPVLEGSRSLP